MPEDSSKDSELVLELGCSSDLGAVASLLGANELPTADVEQHLETFVLAKLHGDLVGVVGVEIYGEVGLLRSLCVGESHRGKGMGRALLVAVRPDASVAVPHHHAPVCRLDLGRLSLLVRSACLSSVRR